ncbi:hypothetical protein PGT21_009008 [Puccinia graminis f. sp. tritici]|uniref:Uncharacterized protein n=1 Tax=Puccinia graminis f. sp. tritici TaxID=56615 RepID=A0A5B0N056_PUCGR|nr:hypothetical protein PGT21_009008 [Puccinia graminis f. sp. tritici]
MLINKKLTERPEESEVPEPALPDNRVVISSIDLHYCLYVNSDIIYYQRPRYDDEEATINQGDYQRLMSFGHIEPLEVDLDRTDFESFKSQVLLQLANTRANYQLGMLIEHFESTRDILWKAQVYSYEERRIVANYDLHERFRSWKYDVLTSPLDLHLSVMILMDHPDASDDPDDLVSLLRNVHDGGVQGFG